MVTVALTWTVSIVFPLEAKNLEEAQYALAAVLEACETAEIPVLTASAHSHPFLTVNVTCEHEKDCREIARQARRAFEMSGGEFGWLHDAN